MRLLWLPVVLRAAGLTVHEVDGWRTRGSANWGPIVGLTCHHTAGARNSSDAGEIGVLVNGRPGLPGPIAQLYLSRTGHWHVVASGRANHNKVGWAGPNEGYGNSNLIGVEAQHSGGDEPWTETQYRSYVRGVAAIARQAGFGPNRVGGHKEHQPGEKSDPTFSMTRFRIDVATNLEDDVTQAELEQAVMNGIGKLLEEAEARSTQLGRNAGNRIRALMVDPTVSSLVATINEVDEATAAAVISALGDQERPVDEVAAALRAALGDRAEQVGRALAGIG